MITCVSNVGVLLLTRVMAVTFCVTLAASLAARLGSTEMAAFQVCLQVWLATSLLADGLAVAGQVIPFITNSAPAVFVQLCESDFIHKVYAWFVSVGYTCKCICQKRLQPGSCHSIPSPAGNSSNIYMQGSR